MTDNYLGEIRPFAFNFCPKGWAYCDGSLLLINEYAALYSLLGTNYGGDGRESFALPDLRSRTPISGGETNGNLFYVGLNGGEETVALTVHEMPAHSHGMKVSNSLGVKPYAGRVLAIPNKGDVHFRIYNGMISSPVSLNETTIGIAGESHPHNNMQPFLTVNYCIAVTGQYPPRP
ncbi:MAG: tail fiber protein [Bacteroidales bacterium]|jgi:microcystin-dependent protein|nr:tail fiber protein [Bacteroidales bacterium]